MEARGGRPFVGPSGKLLDAVLQHYGIQRGEIHLTNAALCRPADGGNPPASAVAACNDRLIDELRSSQASSVLALGNTAAQALLETKLGITSLRVGPGRISDKLPGIRIVPTVHPAACLRQPDMFPFLERDTAKLVNPQPEWTPPKYVVWDDLDTALAGLAALTTVLMDRRGDDQRVPLVIDIEVGIDKEESFGHPNEYQQLCIGLCWDDYKVAILGEEVVKNADPETNPIWDALAELLDADFVSVTTQNGKFDGAGLYALIGALKNDFDTMLASYSLDERRGIHSLDTQGIELLGTPDWKTPIKRYTKGGSYALIPRPKLYEYLAYDCSVTLRLRALYERRLVAETPAEWPWEHLGLPRKTLRDLHDMLVRAGNQLMFVELNGLAVDLTYNNKLTYEYLEVLEPLEKAMVAITGEGYDARYGFNPRSPKQVKEYYHDKAITVPMKRNQKNEMAESTDEESLNEILAKLDPESPEATFTRTLLEHRRHSKLYGTFVKGIRKRTYRGRVFPTFLLHGTTTGRLACRNPNLQNIPRESRIRKQFVPAKAGNVFVGVDYSQAELRVLTFLAQEPYFQAIFNDPSRDLFDELRPVLYPHLTPEVVAGMVAIQHGDKTPEQVQANKEHLKDLRVRIKAYVYGLSYGREEFSIAHEFGIPVQEAKLGMDRFFNVIPNIVAFRDEIKRKVQEGENLITPFGRQRRYGLITNENLNDVLKEALAFMPQSTASDLCLNAFMVARPQLKGKAFIRNLIHDAMLVEAHPDDAEEVGQIISDIMIETAYNMLAGDYVKFKCDVTIGNSWGEV
jgi:uracil-DNA glycosylase family 4